MAAMAGSPVMRANHKEGEGKYKNKWERISEPNRKAEKCSQLYQVQTTQIHGVRELRHSQHWGIFTAL